MKTSSSLAFCVFCSFLISFSICVLATLAWAGEPQQAVDHSARRSDGSVEATQPPETTPAQQDSSSQVTDRTSYVVQTKEGAEDTFWQLAWIDLAAPGKQDGRAQLGVHVRSPDDTIRSHLQLADGVGLVVEFVVPESAAADANVQVHDVLKSLDDQILVNDSQLRTLIGMKQPGDSISLGLLRQGAAEDVSVVLKAGEATSSVELLDFRHNQLTESALAALAQAHHQVGSNVHNCKACHVVSGNNASSNW